MEISKSNQSLVSVDIWLGKSVKVKVYTKEDIYKIIKKGQKKKLKEEI